MVVVVEVGTVVVVEDRLVAVVVVVEGRLVVVEDRFVEDETLSD